MLRTSLGLAAAVIVMGGLVIGACGDDLRLGPIDAPSGHVDAPADAHRDAAVDSSPPDAPLGCVVNPARPLLQALISGDILIGATAREATLPIDVPLTRSVLFTSVREAESSPQFGAVICDLHAADPTNAIVAGITCRHQAPGTDNPASTGEIHIHYRIATFVSGVSVQRGIADTNVVNPTLVTLTPAVDLATSFVVLGGTLAGGGGWGNNDFARARLIDTQTLDIRHVAPGSQVAWQMVTMLGASVQRGTLLFATTDLQRQVALAPVPLGSLVLASYNSDNPSSIAASILMLRASLAGTTLQLSREMAGSALDVSWEVISLPYATHQVTSTFAIGEASRTEPVAGLLPATSVVVASNQSVMGQAGGSTTYAGPLFDLLGEAAATLTPTGAGVVVERASSTATASITFSTIDFSKNCLGM